MSQVTYGPGRGAQGGDRKEQAGTLRAAVSLKQGTAAERRSDGETGRREANKGEQGRTRARSSLGKSIGR